MAARRRGRPSTYEQRRERMDELLWALTREELQSPNRRPGPSDLATRAVLADALAESGNLPLAQALMRWPADRPLWGTRLERKLHTAVRGPSPRGRLAGPRRPLKILLALIYRGGPLWVKVDRNVGGPHDGHPYLVEMGQGYSSTYGLVWARSESDAYEIAEEAFPWHFFEEVDEEELEEHAEENIRGPHPSKPGVWLVEDENGRYQTSVIRAHRVVSARRLDEYGRQARLRTGEVIEYVA